MTEGDWLACTDTGPMLAFLLGGGKASDRKLRLFMAACCRSIWQHLPDECSRQAIEAGEQFADGLTNHKKREAAWDAIRIAKETAVGGQDFPLARRLLDTEGLVYDNMKREGIYGPWRANTGTFVFLLDIFGNPFRPTSIDPHWLTPAVTSLATAAYDERILPSGHLDLARLAVLSDALEEVGCADGALLDHLRSPGPHVRGCWPVDLLTGRS